MAMGARFDETLEWDGNDLEVCGPAFFDGGVTMVEVISFSITDSKGHTKQHLCLPSVRALPGVNGGMWESEIPNAKGGLVSGSARGFGFALLHFAPGTVPQGFHWTQPDGSIKLAIE